MIRVVLTWYEFHGAAWVGMQRWAQSETKNLRSRIDLEQTYIQRMGTDVVGACGERAYCKHRQIYWEGSVNTFRTIPDVNVPGHKVEVRTSYNPEGKLLIRDDDSDDYPFVLVTGGGPEFIIRGWLLAKECKQEKWRRDPGNYGPCWLVPQEDLRDLALL